MQKEYAADWIEIVLDSIASEGLDDRPLPSGLKADLTCLAAPQELHGMRGRARFSTTKDLESSARNPVMIPNTPQDGHVDANYARL